MRESFGGAFMIKMVLVFIVVYVSFMAVAVNYAKVFRVKNRVMDILEQYQYSGKNDTTTLGIIETSLNSLAYQVGTNNYSKLEKECTDANTSAVFASPGVCITPYTEGTSRYYRVTTYIIIDFPFFNLHLTLPISGDTKSMGEWREIE